MKFFNKQRIQSLSLKKLKKYLLYAVGEVILVVTGILIAVAINNANEETKNEKELQQIAKQLQAKIDRDLIAIKELKRELELTKGLFDDYLFPTDTISDNRKKNAINQAPYLVTVGIDLLAFDPTINALDRVNLQNDSLSVLISRIDSFFNDASKTFDLQEQVITDLLIENINYIRKNFTWYEKIALLKGKFTEEEYAYFKSTDYRNRVVHMYSIYLEAYYYQIDYFGERLKQFNVSLDSYIVD